jgi:tRNA-specific 2-thiouridylase
VQVRHRAPDVPCRVEWEGSAARVRFGTPLRGVAPGQYAALYDGEECLGGGVIEATFAADSQPVARRPAAVAN